MTIESFSNTTEVGHFSDLGVVEKYMVRLVLSLLFLMGLVGNTVILHIIRGFKPAVSTPSLTLYIIMVCYVIVVFCC